VPDAPRARLAEVLAALSLATDLGAAWPPETALRTCLVGVELARRLGLGEPEVADVYFLTLLRSVAHPGWERRRVRRASSSSRQVGLIFGCRHNTGSQRCRPRLLAGPDPTS
jgi:hypothetical protein